LRWPERIKPNVIRLKALSQKGALDEAKAVIDVTVAARNIWLTKRQPI